MKLLTYLHDPDNLYVPLIKSTKFTKELQQSLIAISPTTTKKVKNLISDNGFEIIKGGKYGTARLNLVKHAQKYYDDDFFFLCDFDKLIHWIKTNKVEFLSFFKNTPKYDLTVIARSSRALSTYPETWLNTESIAKRIMSKIIRQQVDFMNGPLILSKKALKFIAENGHEKGVGSCAEFCILVSQAKLTITNLEVDGLTWEDPDRYPKLIEKSKTYDDWKYDTYHSLYEWRKRVDFLNKQVEVMIRLSEEPLNPKYPVVHNKILEKN